MTHMTQNAMAGCMENFVAHLFGCADKTSRGFHHMLNPSSMHSSSLLYWVQWVFRKGLLHVSLLGPSDLCTPNCVSLSVCGCVHAAVCKSACVRACVRVW